MRSQRQTPDGWVPRRAAAPAFAFPFFAFWRSFLAFFAAALSALATCLLLLRVQQLGSGLLRSPLALRRLQSSPPEPLLHCLLCRRAIC